MRNIKDHKLILNTELKSYIGENEYKDMQVTLYSSREKKTVLMIHEKGSQGFSYYLENLLGLEKHSNPLNDKLYIDFGRDMYVIGMKKVYLEIINNVVLKGISI